MALNVPNLGDNVLHFTDTLKDVITKVLLYFLLLAKWMSYEALLFPEYIRLDLIKIKILYLHQNIASLYVVD